MKYYGCKRVHVSHYPKSSTGLLPVERTSRSLAHKIIDIDYADPLICKTKKGKEGKVYILLFMHNFTRATHLEL